MPIVAEEILPPEREEKADKSGLLKDRGDGVLDRVEGITDTSGKPIKLYVGNLEEGKPVGVTSEAEDGTPILSSMEGGGGGGGEETRFIRVGKINTSTGAMNYDGTFTEALCTEIADECGKKLSESKYPNVKFTVDFDSSTMVLNPTYFRKYNRTYYVSFVGDFMSSSLPYRLTVEVTSGGSDNITLHRLAVAT